MKYHFLPFIICLAVLFVGTDAAPSATRKPRKSAPLGFKEKLKYSEK